MNILKKVSSDRNRTHSLLTTSKVPQSITPPGQIEVQNKGTQYKLFCRLKFYPGYRVFQLCVFGRFVGNFAREISKTKQHCLQFISKYIHTNILYLSFNWGVAGGDWTLDTIIHTQEVGTPSPQQKQVDPCTFFNTLQDSKRKVRS